MIQSWLIFAGLLIVASAQLAPLPGPCASIGYNTSCCPPEGACLSNDGGCSCSADCHIFGDCCEDVHCPSRPRTCADIGITHCCNDLSGKALCNVHDQYTNYKCSCDVSCHARNDCCPDAKIFCKPCYSAGKYPECCYSNRENASACFAPEGNCYCDPLCKFYGDCCADAQSNSSQCSSDSNPLPMSRLQSSQNDRSFSRRRFYNREGRVYRHRGITNYAYQEARAARVQKELINERKFRSRSRPRVAG